MAEEKDKIVAVKLKLGNGQYSPQIPVASKAKNVIYQDLSDNSTYPLTQILGNLDLHKGNISDRLDINGQAIATAAGEWLTEHLSTPIATTAIVDDTLSIPNQAAEAVAAGKVVIINGETPASVTKFKVDTHADSINILTDEDIDSTLTIEDAAANAKTTGDKIAEIENVLEQLNTEISLPQEYWGHHGFASASGAYSSNAKRLATNNYIPKSIQSVYPKTGYQIIIFAWDDSDIYQGCWNGTGWQKSLPNWSSSKIEFHDLPNNYNYKILARLSTDTEITVPECSNIIFCSFTDPALNINGIAADAKATGNRITELNYTINTTSDASIGNKWLTFYPGYYRTSTTSGTGEIVYYSGSNQYAYAICPCQQGDVFTARVGGPAGVSRAYIFCREDMTWIKKEDPNIQLNGEIIAPANAAYVIFNNQFSKLNEGYYAYKGHSIKNNLIELNNQTNYIQEQTNYLQEQTNYLQESVSSSIIPYAANGTGSISNITATMQGGVITLNGKSEATSSQGYTKINVAGTFAVWNLSATPDAAKVYPLKLVSGHTYRISATVLGGTRDKGDGAGYIRIRLVSTAENVVDLALGVTDDFVSGDYLSDGTPLTLRVLVGRLLTCSNLQIELNIRDVTDEAFLDDNHKIHELFPDMLNSESYADNIYQNRYQIDSGYYSKDDGTTQNGTAYVRTSKLTKFGGHTIRANIAQGYNLSARLWDANDSFDKTRNTEFVNTAVIYVPTGWKIAFNFRNESITSLSDADKAAIRAGFHLYTSGNGIEQTTVQGAINFNDLKQTGTYRFASNDSGEKTNSPTSDWGRLIVFNSTDGYTCAQFYISYKNQIFSRVLTNAANNTWTSWNLLGGADNDVSMHDGEILRMESDPDPIPVNDSVWGHNQVGYNDFISTTWDTLLPDNYQPGDTYDASKTKIINVHVEKETLWQSTPYGSNTDVYPIHRYTFTPVNGYTKTAFLSSGCHGNEAEAYWGLYRIIRMIYFEGYKYPTLRNLRNVRFIIVPSWNPWGMQHFRRYNAFESDDYQAWKWLWATNNTIVVNNVSYPIADVGEAKVIKDTLDTYAGKLNVWIDFHTDPYAGRNTTGVTIDDPRSTEPNYGFYAFVRKNTVVCDKIRGIMEDFYNILKSMNFNEYWYLRAISGNSSGSSGFSGWMASMPFPAALVEVSTFMTSFPYTSGSAGMMRMAQEFYGEIISELICLNGWN